MVVGRWILHGISVHQNIYVDGVEEEVVHVSNHVA